MTDKFKTIPHGLSISIIKHNKEETNYWGYRDRHNKVDIDTNFNIASISKLVTSIIYLISIDGNLVALDDKASKYIAINYDFTIRSLLNHTSGIITTENDEQLLYNINTLHRPDYKANIICSQSNDFCYNAYNYFLLKDIIEAIYNMPYNSIVNLLFERYGLQHPPLILENTAHNNIALPYSDSNKAFLEYDIKELSTQRNLSGGLYCSSNHLNRFLHHFFTNKCSISNHSFDELTNFANNIYGLGLFKYEINDTIYWGHSGESFGYCSQFILNSKSKNCCTILANTDNRAVIRSVLRSIFKDSTF